MAREAAVALVTGGGAGIGKACARRFVKEGYRVMIGDVSAEDGEETRNVLTSEGGEVLFVQGNVAQESDVIAWAQKALDAWGRIDVLINNAGIIGKTGTVWELPIEEMDRVYGLVTEFAATGQSNKKRSWKTTDCGLPHGV